MCARQPAVLQRQPAAVELLYSPEERLRRQGRGRSRLVITLLPGHREFHAQPELGVLVRNDGHTGLAEAFVRTGVVPVPVRVEERDGRFATGVIANDLEQLG